MIKKEKRGFITQALDNAKLELSKLLSSNYNALIFFSNAMLVHVFSLNCFPLNVRHTYIFTFKMIFNVHSISFVKNLIRLYLCGCKWVF